MKNKREVSNSEDILDSRDIISRIEDLQSERDDLVSDIDTLKEDTESAEANPIEHAERIAEAEASLAAWDDSDEATELKTLNALADEGSGSPDWNHGEALIRDSYFEEYAEDLADDIGAINRNATWPCNCIDWEEAADQLKQDYFSVDFDGIEYWIRS